MPIHDPIIGGIKFIGHYNKSVKWSTDKFRYGPDYAKLNYSQYEYLSDTNYNVLTTPTKLSNFYSAIDMQKTLGFDDWQIIS